MIVKDIIYLMKSRSAFHDLGWMFVFAIAAYWGGIALYDLHLTNVKLAWWLALVPTGIVLYLQALIIHAMARRIETLQEQANQTEMTSNLTAVATTKIIEDAKQAFGNPRDDGKFMRRRPS